MVSCKQLKLSQLQPAPNVQWSMSAKFLKKGYIYIRTAQIYDIVLKERRAYCTSTNYQGIDNLACWQTKLNNCFCNRRFITQAADNVVNSQNPQFKEQDDTEKGVSYRQELL